MRWLAPHTLGTIASGRNGRPHRSTPEAPYCLFVAGAHQRTPSTTFRQRGSIPKPCDAKADRFRIGAAAAPGTHDAVTRYTIGSAPQCEKSSVRPKSMRPLRHHCVTSTPIGHGRRDEAAAPVPARPGEMFRALASPTPVWSSVTARGGVPTMPSCLPRRPSMRVVLPKPSGGARHRPGLSCMGSGCGPLTTANRAGTVIGHLGERTHVQFVRPGIQSSSARARGHARYQPARHERTGFATRVWSRHHPTSRHHPSGSRPRRRFVRRPVGLRRPTAARAPARRGRSRGMPRRVPLRRHGPPHRPDQHPLASRLTR